MNRFEFSKLWQRSLAPKLSDDIYQKERELLRIEYEKFRENASVVAKEIARDLPQFTVHDIAHIDALWSLSDLIIRDDFELTPTEAFVLGGAFLIHDLGMGLAAYPEGLSELKKSYIWRDTVAYLYKNKHNRYATEDEIENPSQDIEQLVLESVLRSLHAKHAENLVFTKWTDPKNQSNTYYLIDNVELRVSFGKIIGLIAHSHWWPVEELPKKINTVLGAPNKFPKEWTIDPIKLATILRIADAANIDDSRSPGFLKAIRKISGDSELHWNFQQKLYQPRFEKERLVYTSKLPFKIDEADAWWLCYDTLKLLDSEIKDVDSLLSETGRQRLNVIGVTSIEDPERLSKLITVENWKPIDTQIKVGNVAQLAIKLGGIELYGENYSVPVRELIQNSADAIRARRILENENEFWGDVTIRKIINDSGHFIEIEDNGIGMSPKVLTGPFLDFGQSFWGSTLMHEEFPGLESKLFESTGKYGIGFFSAFMIGEKISVFSRRFEDARENTWCLEFLNGVHSRPILRKANTEEYIKNGGTKIRIKTTEVFWNKFIETRNIESEWDIEDVIKKLCIAVDVNIYYQVNDEDKVKLIRANDWIDIPITELLERTCGKKNFIKIREHAFNQLSLLSKNAQLIYEKNTIVGRGFLCRAIYDHGMELSGLITVGGHFADELHEIQGVIIGQTKKASRDVAVALASFETVADFLSTQLDKISKNKHISQSEKIRLGSVGFRLGGEPKNLPLARSQNDYYNFESLIKYFVKIEGRIIIIDHIYQTNKDYRTQKEIILLPNVLITELYDSDHFGWLNSANVKRVDVLLDLILRAFATARKIDDSSARDHCYYSQTSELIGHAGDIPIYDGGCYILDNNKSHNIKIQ